VIQRLSAFFYRVSRGKVALAATVFFVAFTAIVPPAQARKALTYTNGAPTPDTSFFYTSHDLHSWAGAYGAVGRSDYVMARFTFDVVWPLVYTFFLVTVLSWLLGRFLATDSRWRRVNTVATLPLIFDYAENVSASIVISRYPAGTPILADVVTVFTMAKWVTLVGTFILIAWVGFALLVRRWRTTVPKKVGI
jgi:hypothetical protein